MEALENSLGRLPNSIITRVILVDDNSSEEDRDIMKTKYPNFEFYFKPPQDRGHANTMNKIFNLIQNEYMLYLEDDWKLFDQPVLLDSLASAVLNIKKDDSRSTRDHLFESILLASMEILSKGDIQQVLFNSQSTRACAIGSNCDYDTIKFAGWERFVLYNNSISIPYSFHEFGISSHLPGTNKLLSYGGRTHDFAMWPGLTLNPGLWNVAKIKKMLISCLHDQEGRLYDENDKLFEHRFSSLGYAAGVSIGYLPAVLFEHIGDVSAYERQFKRPWDDKKEEL
jgi:glycosyltransferase involved in cell wall biosynthesis